MATTIIELLKQGRDGDPAIGATSDGGARPALSFGEFKALIAATVGMLNGNGVGRNDRVAMVLPNGPEMAASFLAVGAGATTAPLNPAYREDEFDFYITDLKPKALLIQQSMDSPARGVAAKHGVPLIELKPRTDGPAGTFDLLAPSKAVPPTYALPGDIALILHTSGTTSRPKMVPLTQSNICATARHIGETLALQPGDVCLNIMPLFHIHGLMAAVLSSVAAGGSVVCSPGFNALRFFAWLDEAKPTWYTAVPTMHQTILARAARNQDSIKAARLRLIRSSSSSLPSQVMTELERVFGCPVIESYGMTEAAHQMASNPLPPKPRKPGSVGIPAGPRIAIMDAQGNELEQGETGEVVIAGPNVTPGYLDNPTANAGAFTNGWFRTGDQGVIDKDGYLQLTGRLKEIINRGGEKISPLEVDEVLMDHPAVAQVVCFAVPHDKLGEDVAACVVLREGMQATERELRDHCAKRLADFKVPRKVLMLAEIPKGATGKLQRIGLAQKLGLA